MSTEKNYPMGGFVANAICPHCGQEVRVNVPATPTDSRWLKSKTRCVHCKCSIYVKRYQGGEWTVWDN